MVYSIDNEKSQKLVAVIGNKTYYGACQKWYPKHIQRISGCAPTVASNLCACIKDVPFAAKEQRLEIMQTMWRYITPDDFGVDTAQDFAKGSNDFFVALALPYKCVFVKYDDDTKPQFYETAQFIKFALADNCPVAFLNLSNGKINLLEPWHWVTIVSFDDSTNEITVFDGDKKFDMNLKLWHDTTTKRGGFSRYQLK